MGFQIESLKVKAEKLMGKADLFGFVTGDDKVLAVRRQIHTTDRYEIVLMLSDEGEIDYFSGEFTAVNEHLDGMLTAFEFISNLVE